MLHLRPYITVDESPSRLLRFQFGVNILGEDTRVSCELFVVLMPRQPIKLLTDIRDGSLLSHSSLHAVLEIVNHFSKHNIIQV